MYIMAIPIRCTNFKPHTIYTECGSLMGAIDNDSIYFHCTSCKNKKTGNWFKVWRDENDGLRIKRMPCDFKLDFNNDEIKLVE